MKLTNEALEKMILEEMEKVEEKFDYPDSAPLSLKVKTSRSIPPRLADIGLNRSNRNFQAAFDKIRNLDNAPN